MRPNDIKNSSQNKPEGEQPGVQNIDLSRRGFLKGAGQLLLLLLPTGAEVRRGESLLVQTFRLLIKTLSIQLLSLEFLQSWRR